MKITNPITLDVARSNSYICLLAKQFDSNSRYLEITLADNGQPLTIPADASAVLRATRADGTGAVVSGTVANGKATVEIDDYILEVNGAVTLSLEISKDGEILTTPSCNLTIQKADASGWIRVYIADSSKAAGNYYITIGGVSYSFTTSQAIPAGGSVYFSSNNATAETRNATGAVIETGLVLTEGTTGTQLVTDVPTMSFLATIAGRVAALESEMPNKADKDGIIALAENLTPYSSTSGATQTIPFINQGTGCGNGETQVDTGSYSQIKNKNGNSAGVNQMFPDYPDSTNTIDGVTITAAGGYITLSGTAGADIFNAYELTFTPVSGHKYLIMADATGTPAASEITWQWYLSGGGLGLDYEIFRKIYTAADNSQVTMRLAVYNGVTVNIKSMMPRVIDLSIWFGSTDRIPANLLSHPEDWGRYYAGSLAYNAGTLDSADGTVMRSIGRNQWDEQWENGAYNSSGEKTTSSTALRNVNHIRVIGGTVYSFTVPSGVGNIRTVWRDVNENFLLYTNASSTLRTAPSNAYYLDFAVMDYGATYGNNITISLYYPGESGYDQYYPFSVLAQIDTGSEVLRSAEAVADEKTPDGTITRRVGYVDLGTLNWSKYDTPQGTLFRSDVISGANIPASSVNYCQCALYANVTYSNRVDKSLSLAYANQIDIIDSSYADAATFKTAMSGVMMNYRLATPTTEQGTPFSGASADNFAVDDFGSMYWTQSAGVPQGVEIFYPYDYKAAVDTILNEVNGDVTKLVTSEKVPDAPSSNGTYVLKVTVSGGTPAYSWVAE